MSHAMGWLAGEDVPNHQERHVQRPRRSVAGSSERLHQHRAAGCLGEHAVSALSTCVTKYMHRRACMYTKRPCVCLHKYVYVHTHFTGSKHLPGKSCKLRGLAAPCLHTIMLCACTYVYGHLSQKENMLWIHVCGHIWQKANILSEDGDDPRRLEVHDVQCQMVGLHFVSRGLKSTHTHVWTS